MKNMALSPHLNQIKNLWAICIRPHAFIHFFFISSHSITKAELKRRIEEALENREDDALN